MRQQDIHTYKYIQTYYVQKDVISIGCGIILRYSVSITHGKSSFGTKLQFVIFNPREQLPLMHVNK